MPFYSWYRDGTSLQGYYQHCVDAGQSFTKEENCWENGNWEGGWNQISCDYTPGVF